jgi:hypothetical protein
MRFFKRGENDATGDFWTWWAGGRDRVAQAIATGGFDNRLIEDISKAVRTIHPEMAWELQPGRTAQHAFCVSPEGNPELRQAALRWIATAPPADATWEYHPAKQASARLMGLEIGGSRFDLDETRTISSWDETRRRVDVRLWHPGFPAVPESVRQQVAFLFLDGLLGEEEVERWVGEITLLDAPTGGRTPDELKAEIERRRQEPGGDQTWVLGELARPNGEVEIVLADAALKRIDHPFADYHAEIVVLLAGKGMPSDDEATVLNAEEETLLGLLDGVAVYAGRTTAPGRRTMHFVTADTDAMRPGIDAWAAGLPDAWPNGEQRRIKINFGEDMHWTFQREIGIR